ncbi:MAG: hypothetical protein HKN18_16215 [Silicimonas sp.]|nr:hypothetical protein [Silicimonas sp.]NND43123.1 hypothetical protein [Silicimonas sp.]NNE81813.1 hypothetical protein [Silicimonas sp.]
MRTLIHALVALIIPTATLAGACGPDQDADIGLIEDAKAAFLDADYRKFVTIAGPYFPDLEQNFDDYFGQIQVVFPNGFDRCATILQRRESPGFHQDLVFYFPAGSPAPMALLLIAAKVDGEMQLVEFTYNTSISDVLDDLK